MLPALRKWSRQEPILSRRSPRPSVPSGCGCSARSRSMSWMPIKTVSARIFWKKPATVTFIPSMPPVNRALPPSTVSAKWCPFVPSRMPRRSRSMWIIMSSWRSAWTISPMNIPVWWPRSPNTCVRRRTSPAVSSFSRCSHRIRWATFRRWTAPSPASSGCSREARKRKKPRPHMNAFPHVLPQSTDPGSSRRSRARSLYRETFRGSPVR